MTIKHTDRCPFADLDGGILTPAGACPCQEHDDVTLALMGRAREDLRHEETGRRRWLVNVPDRGVVQEAEAPDALEAATQVVDRVGLDSETVSPDEFNMREDSLVARWRWVCEVVPMYDVVDAILGQVAPTRIEVTREIRAKKI